MCLNGMNIFSDNRGETVMSEELQLFNERVSDLNMLLKSLLEIASDAFTLGDLHALQQRRHILSASVRNRGTLNTGGHFEWVDSKIVRALKIGQYICLEHVNLCSSAILDRLNSVFEVDGKLLLSEKGVEANNQSECVNRHTEFRAFLTLDPRNGEISRAMRNRCVELSLAGDTYTVDDLKQIIYSNGIHEMHLIHWTLNVHRCVQHVSEFHAFNVSHLAKFAFLINENLRLGMNESNALFDSAVVVYVRSSHTDLLGMGLNYYHEKLIEAIRCEIDKVPDKCQDIVQFSHYILSADNLNALALIRLQCEPLLTTIDCLCAELEPQRIQTVFNATHRKFNEISLNLDWKSAEYLLYMIYEMSSLDDLNMRRQYIDAKIHGKMANASDSSINRLAHLLELNQALANTIRECPRFAESARSTSSALHNLPWNQHIFPRLRDYVDAMPLLTKPDQLKLSAILLARSLFDRIHVDTTQVKQSQITAIAYSKAVNDGIIPNGLNMDLITLLHPLLDGIKTFTIHIIQHAAKISYQQYGSLIFAYFWVNRLYAVAQGKLFREKAVDQTLIDRLALHFNWLQKHLLNQLNQLITMAMANDQQIDGLAQFRKILHTISECNTIQRHPLNEMRKQFTKRLIEFMPFYEQTQIEMHTNEVELMKHQQLPARKWQSNDPAEYLQLLANKYRIILSDEMMNYKNHLVNCSDLSAINDGDDNKINSLNDSDWPEKLKHLTKSMSTLLTPSNATATEQLVEENTKFAKYVESVGGNANGSHLAPLKLVVSMLPIMEYFGLRALNSVLQRKAANFKPNVDFYKNIRSIDIDVLNLIWAINGNQYQVAESIWNRVQLQLGTQNLETIFNEMPQSIYRRLLSALKMFDSRVLCFGYNSLALNYHYLLNGIESDSKPDAMPTNSCPLTVSTFLSLFNEHGQSKSIGLGNLEIWSTALQSLSKLLWNNVELFQSQYQFECTHFNYSKQCGRKLLAEIEYIQTKTKSLQRKSTIESEFLDVIEMLETQLSAEENSDCRTAESAERRFQQFYKAAQIQSLVAMVELHLMTFTPLVDPVEKNRLKRAYTETNQQHLDQLMSAYDFMKIVMSFNGLGEQIITESLRSKLIRFEDLRQKYSGKCAIRPDQCVYAELVDQINFYLENGCRPKSQLQLINDIDAAFNRLNNGNSIAAQDLQRVDEIIKRIDWCTNTAESFERSTVLRFDTYYHDFTAPLKSTVMTLKYSFLCLKQCLIKSRESILVSTKLANSSTEPREAESLSSVLVNLIEFPKLAKHSNLMPATMRMLENVDNSDASHARQEKFSEMFSINLFKRHQI